MSISTISIPKTIFNYFTEVTQLGNIQVFNINSYMTQLQQEITKVYEHVYSKIDRYDMKKKYN
jgi:hypothetical protein